MVIGGYRGAITVYVLGNLPMRLFVTSFAEWEYLYPIFALIALMMIIGCRLSATDTKLSGEVREFPFFNCPCHRASSSYFHRVSLTLSFQFASFIFLSLFSLFPYFLTRFTKVEQPIFSTFVTKEIDRRGRIFTLTLDAAFQYNRGIHRVTSFGSSAGCFYIAAHL